MCPTLAQVKEKIWQAVDFKIVLTEALLEISHRDLCSTHEFNHLN
jgi:hypothetical protein